MAKTRKTLGRRAKDDAAPPAKPPPARRPAAASKSGEPEPAPARKAAAAARSAPGRRTGAKAEAGANAPDRLRLTDENLDLIRRLSERTRLEPAVVLERALTAYAAAAAPGMPLHVEPPRPRGKDDPPQKLFLSVDGKPEVEVKKTVFVLGSAEGVDLRLDLPLISARHARILWRDGRAVFEDLQSARGSYRLGQPVDVRMLETGDEIDLGGFLPIRFRLAESGA